MARYAGKSGQIEVDSVTPAELLGVRSWELDYKGDAVDVTGFDSSGAKAFIAACTEWSVSMEAFALGAIDSDIRPGSTLKVDLEQQSGDGSYWYGDTIVTDVKPTVAVDGAVIYSVTAQGTGALTWGARA